MTVDQAFQIAFEHQEAGRAAEAERICRQILVVMPNHAGALHLIGVIALRSGRFTEAADLISRAIVVQPGAAYFHVNMGNALLFLGRREEAVTAFRQAIQLEPRRADAYNNLANVLMDMGRAEEAASVFSRAAELNSDEPAIQSNLGYALSNIGRFDDAIIALNRAIKLRPNEAETHNNLGIANKGLGKLDDAIASYRRAIELRPDYAEAHSNLGNALRAKGQLDEAVAAYNRAIACKPNNAEAYNNLGNLHAAEGNFEQAIADFNRALQIKPNLFEAQYSLANVLGDVGRFDESMVAFDRAVPLNPEYPDVHLNRGLHLLLRGDFEHGLPEYEWRWKVKCYPPARSFPQPLWDGRELNGKTIFLHNEQGFGDTIQCVRYLPLIVGRGGKIILGCAPPLAGLLSQLGDIARIITGDDLKPEFDFHCPLMSLPLAFKTDLNSIPPPLILKPDPAAAEKWKQKLSAEARPRKIGLSWAGNPSHLHDRSRSMNLSQFAPLAELKEAAFFSLQFGEAGKQISPPELMLRDFTSELKDFADTAALIANLDLVVTVDTAVAHLAGSMGKPVWVLLPFKPDWRWMLQREDSPWYPTMRLFRQSKIGDWAGVLDRVVSCLLRG